MVLEVPLEVVLVVLVRFQPHILCMALEVVLVALEAVLVVLDVVLAVQVHVTPGPPGSTTRLSRPSEARSRNSTHEPTPGHRLRFPHTMMALQCHHCVASLLVLLVFLLRFF